MPCAHLLSAACPAETQRAQHRSPARTHVTYLCVRAQTWPMRGTGGPLSFVLPSGLCQHPWLSWAPTPPAGACSHAWASACANMEVCVNTWGCAYVCALWARVCTHTHEFRALGHTRVCTARGASLGARVGGQHSCGLACAVPRHHQMVPCVRVTFWGHKPAPCAGTRGGS